MKKLLLTLIPTLALPVGADTFHLQDGSTMEGDLVRETDDSYVILRQVTPTIRDEHTLKKSEVKSVDKQTQDQAAFEQLENPLPTPDMLDVSDYDQLLQPLEQFLEDFPESDHTSTVNDWVEALNKERTVVAAGGIKYRGEMISAEERMPRAFPLDAEIAASRVRALGDSGNYVAALRAWEVFKDKYGTSSELGDLKSYASRLVRTQYRAVQQSLDTLEKRLADREEGINRLPERDKGRTARAIEQEAASYQRLLEQEKSEDTRWYSISPWNSDVMQDALRELEEESKFIDGLGSRDIPDGEKAWNESWKLASAVSSEETQEGREAIRTAEQGRIPAKYVEMIRQRANEKALEQLEEDGGEVSDSDSSDSETGSSGS